MVYSQDAKKVDPKSSHYKEKDICFLFFFLYLYEMMDGN